MKPCVSICQDILSIHQIPTLESAKSQMDAWGPSGTPGTFKAGPLLPMSTSCNRVHNLIYLMHLNAS